MTSDEGQQLILTFWNICPVTQSGFSHTIASHMKGIGGPLPGRSPDASGVPETDVLYTTFLRRSTSSPGDTASRKQNTHPPHSQVLFSAITLLSVSNENELCLNSLPPGVVQSKV
jgi:hypothetical protein